MLESKHEDMVQGTISSFFKPKPTQSAPKRPAFEDVLVIDDSDEDGPTTTAAPPPKRVKVEPSTESDSNSMQGIPATASAPMATGLQPRRGVAASNAKDPKLLKWAYSSSTTSVSAPSQSSLSQEETARRRERIASKLLGKDLLNRRTAYLQEDHYLSANAEASGSRSPSAAAPLFNPAEDGGDENSGPDEIDEDDETSNELPVSSKGKGKAKSRRRGAEVEPTANRFSKFAANGRPSRTAVTQKTKYTPL